VTLFNPNTGAGWVCTNPPNITCTNATLTLQPGQSSMVFAVVGILGIPPPPIENCAELKNPNDTNPNNNKDCIKVTVVGKCDLKITKTVQPNPVPSGQQVTVTLTVQNVGTGTCPPGPFPGTVVSDPKPSGLTFNLPVSISQSGGSATWQCGLGVPTGDLSCATQDPLPPGYSATFTFTATVTAPPGSNIQNCATVNNQNDPLNPANPGNNQSCVTIQVSGPLCRDVTINLSTGVANWTVSPGTVGVITNLANLNGTWVAPTAPARWIQPANASTPQLLPGGFYQYSVSFNLPGPLNQYSSISLSGRYAADNTVHQFFVSPGQSAPGGPLCTPANANCFSTWTPFNITTGFSPGTNTLNVRVYNNPMSGGGPTYTGLVVEATLRAVCKR
jgi:hypothetical protein